MYTQFPFTAFRPVVVVASPVVFVEPALVELISRNVPYDDLVGCYEYTDAEINAAGRCVSHTAPDELLAMLEELAFLEEEEGEWAWY